MSEKSYYSKTGFISNSAIGHYLFSPSKFRKYILGELEEEDNSYLEFGKLVHLKLLEPWVYDTEIVPFEYTIPRSEQQKQFINDYILLKDVDATPELTAYRKAYPLKKDSDEKATEKAKEMLELFVTYRQYLKASETRTVIQQSVHDTIKTVESNVKAHKLAAELLYDVSPDFSDGKREAFNEIDLYSSDSDGFKYKALLDRIVIDHENKVVQLVDLKTTSKLHKFRESFDNYDYSRQLAFYDDMIRNNSERLKIDDSYEIQHYIVAVDSITLSVKVFRINGNLIQDSKAKIADIVDDIKWHFRNDKWEHSVKYYTGNGEEEIC